MSNWKRLVSIMVTVAMVFTLCCVAFASDIEPEMPLAEPEAAEQPAEEQEYENTADIVPDAHLPAGESVGYLYLSADGSSIPVYADTSREEVIYEIKKDTASIFYVDFAADGMMHIIFSDQDGNAMDGYVAAYSFTPLTEEEASDMSILFNMTPVKHGGVSIYITVVTPDVEEETDIQPEEEIILAPDGDADLDKEIEQPVPAEDIVPVSETPEDAEPVAPAVDDAQEADKNEPEPEINPEADIVPAVEGEADAPADIPDEDPEEQEPVLDAEGKVDEEPAAEEPEEVPAEEETPVEEKQEEDPNEQPEEEAPILEEPVEEKADEELVEEEPEENPQEEPEAVPAEEPAEEPDEEEHLEDYIVQDETESEELIEPEYEGYFPEGTYVMLEKGITLYDCFGDPQYILPEMGIVRIMESIVDDNGYEAYLVSYWGDNIGDVRSYAYGIVYPEDIQETFEEDYTLLYLTFENKV